MYVLRVLVILLGIIEIGWGGVLISRYVEFEDDWNLFFGIIWIGLGIFIILLNTGVISIM